MKFKSLLDAYLGSQEYAGLSQNTKKSYRSCLERFVSLVPAGAIGKNPQTERKHLFDVISAKNVSGRTKNSYLIILNILYRYGCRCNYIPINPLRDIKKFRSTTDKLPAYTKDQVETLWDDFDNYAYDEKLVICFVRAMFWTACRPSELINLDWGDVDDKYLNIRSAKGRENGAISRKLIKSKEISQCLDWIKINTKITTSDTPVFRSAWNCRVDISNTRKVFVQICAKAGLKYKPLRCIRRGLATEMRNYKVDGKYVYTLGDIQAQLGHKSRSTTELYLSDSLEDKANRFKGLG